MAHISASTDFRAHPRAATLHKDDLTACRSGDLRDNFADGKTERAACDADDSDHNQQEQKTLGCAHLSSGNTIMQIPKL